jgi:hypothetical protein
VSFDGPLGRITLGSVPADGTTVPARGVAAPAPTRDSLSTRRSIGSTRSSRRPKFSVTIRLPDRESARLAVPRSCAPRPSVMPGISAVAIRHYISALSSPMLLIVSSACRVSFTDSAGVTHTVSVAATSLYEAAALGIAEFRRCGLPRRWWGRPRG